MGWRWLKLQLPSLAEDEGRDLLEMISVLFYIDPLDLPGHVPVIEDAITLVGSMGAWGPSRRCFGSWAAAMSRLRWPSPRRWGIWACR